MGTGKTRVALAVADRLRCRRVLVITPLSASGVWRNEVQKLRLPVRVMTLRAGSIPERARRMQQFDDGMAIVNYEAYWKEPLRTQIVRWNPDMVIYDEAHQVKHRGTKQARFAHVLVTKVRYSLALTGTPISNGVEDLFSIFKAVRPEVFGNRWVDFETRYLLKGGYLGYSIVGYKNQADLDKRLGRYSYRKKKEEILDLPPKTDVVISVPLEPESRKRYEEMRKLAVTQVQGVDAETGQPISGTALARVVLTNVLRLQQMASGFVTLRDGSTADLSHEKDVYLADLLEDMLAQGEQVVIFCRFKNEIRRAITVARKVGGARHRADVLDGSVKQQDRERVIRDFAIGNLRILAIQVAVGSLGIDLSSCSKAIFYGLTYSLTDYLQGKDRLHRIGQRNAVTYYHLLGEHTIDETVYRILQHKEDLAHKTLNRAQAIQLFSVEEDR